MTRTEERRIELLTERRMLLKIRSWIRGELRFVNLLLKEYGIEPMGDE
jgi:hypothetical protein